MSTSWTSARFEDMYEADADPWHMQGRWYEDRKRALVMALLPDRRYTHAFEPGCGTGLLTAQLAQRCAHITAMDASTRALDQARQQVPSPNVTFEHGTIPDMWTVNRPDLIVLSELLYFLDRGDARRVATLSADCLTSQGVIVACHWRHPTNYPQSGDDAHLNLARDLDQLGLHLLASYSDDDILLSSWGNDPHSVAEAGGLDVTGTHA